MSKNFVNFKKPHIYLKIYRNKFQNTIQITNNFIAVRNLALNWKKRKKLHKKRI